MAVPFHMLRALRIRNLAVIQAVEVEFGPGFTVLTGETGAGKSILVEAVGLLLGGRASADLVRTGEAHATIEAVFDRPDGPVTIRREITQHGRSRASVDGAAASASTLREMAATLIELHGQHAHQSLLDPLTHLPVLDTYAQLDSLVSGVTVRWGEMRALEARLDRSQMDARERAARLDLVTFQLGEIEAVAPRPGEDEELASLKQVLASADRLQRLCEESYALLYDGDAAVLAGLAAVWKRLAELAAIEPMFAPHLDARDGIKAQLEDLAFFLRRYAGGIDASPARLQQVEDRLAQLERVRRKYGPSLQDVIDRGQALARERRLLAGDDQGPPDLHRDLAAARDAYLAAARDLSRRRREAAGPFARRLETLLAGLAMDRARFDVRFNDPDPPPDAWTERGIDHAEFFLSPNPGEDPRPLARIASGGELSRVMLALRLPDGGTGAPIARTLVFDEVDAGIGGRVADVVGARLRQLGTCAQVLCITHLPQIAAQATAQFRIDKTIQAGRTRTTIQRLDAAERVEEIARMMAGSGVTEAVRASARNLLDAAAGASAAAPSRSARRR